MNEERGEEFKEVRGREEVESAMHGVVSSADTLMKNISALEVQMLVNRDLVSEKDVKTLKALYARVEAVQEQMAEAVRKLTTHQINIGRKGE